MSKPAKTTLVDPAWSMVSGRQTIGGVLFIAYRTGILRYTNVSEDGKIRLHSSARQNHTSVEVLGHGFVLSPRTGKPHRFQDRRKAALAGIAKRDELS